MHLRKNNIRNKLLFLSLSIVRKTQSNAIHDILGLSTNLIYDTALYEILKVIPGIIHQKQTNCDLRYKEDNQPQYESMVVLISISVAELIRNTLII